MATAKDVKTTGETQQANGGDLGSEATSAPVKAWRFRTSDGDEASLGWTIQQGARPIEPSTIPGAVFTPDELPVAEVQKEAGIDPVSANGNLVVVPDTETAEAVRKGEKEASEVAIVRDSDKVEDKDEKKA